MSNDSCMPDETGGPGIILAFLEGESARVAGRWPAAQRAEALSAELGRHFGPRAAKPSRIVEGGWADRQWTRGCYNANTGPCGLIHFGEALSKPIGPIKWAATETAMPGAATWRAVVQAGRRAAREALARSPKLRGRDRDELERCRNSLTSPPAGRVTGPVR